MVIYDTKKILLEKTRALSKKMKEFVADDTVGLFTWESSGKYHLGTLYFFKESALNMAYVTHEIEHAALYAYVFWICEPLWKVDKKTGDVILNDENAETKATLNENLTKDYCGKMNNILWELTEKEQSCISEKTKCLLARYSRP